MRMDSVNREGNQCEKGYKSTVKIIMSVKALVGAVVAQPLSMFGKESCIQRHGVSLLTKVTPTRMSGGKGAEAGNEWAHCTSGTRRQLCYLKH